jgi:hypothetical protein
MDLDDQQADAGTGENNDEFAFLDVIDEPTEEEPSEVVEGQPILEEGDNPKWAKFLQDVPSAFLPMMKEKLKELDRETNEGFQRKAEEWAPYKPLRELNVDPGVLRQSYEFAQYMAQNPVEIYSQLHDRLTQDPNYRQILEERGLLHAVAAAQADAEETGADPFAADDPIEAVRALEARLADRDREFLELFEQQRQTEQFEAVKAEETQNIENSFTAIEGKIGRPLDIPMRRQITGQAIMMGQQQGRYVSVEEAAVEVFRFLKQARPRQSAPRTIPGGGNIPQAQVANPADMDKDQRIEAVMRIRDQLAERD